MGREATQQLGGAMTDLSTGTPAGGLATGSAAQIDNSGRRSPSTSASGDRSNQRVDPGPAAGATDPDTLRDMLLE